jgi:tetratricopeptide (TPR) repeat protein
MATVGFRLAFAAVTLVAIAAASVFGYRHLHRAAPDRSLTLGIVPFEASGEGAAALADSFRFDLADSLAEIPSIEVRAAHSFDDLGAHSGGGQDEAQIQARAERLGVSTILFGRFAVTGPQCQLQLELVRSRDGMHLMSLQYSGTREQLASIRDRIEHDVFERLHTAGPNLSASSTHAASPKAYEAYLRGRSYLAQWTDDALHQAIGSFEEALAADPAYARADAGMASAYYVLAQHGSAGRNEDLDRSRAYAQRALNIDPSIAEAHAMLGEVALSKDWNFALAQTELNTATELDPSHAIYHQWLSILECVEGKYDLALQQIDRAHGADPDWAPPYMTEIYIADSAGQWDRADRAATVLLHKMPDWPLAHEQNAENLWTSGRYAAAIDEWHRAAVLDRNPDRAALEERGARALREGGVQAYARLRLNAIQTRKGISYEEYDFVPAEWDAYAGEWDQALDDLEKLLESHSTLALQTGSNPAFLPLHKNPRFIALLTRFGVPFHPATDR